jgi:selenocysteine lyase/cysteine desulfurase
MMLRRLFRPAVFKSIARNYVIAEPKITLNPRVDTPKAITTDEDNTTRAIYFDVGATTPVDPRVLDKMLPLYTEMYGNPHSRTHEYGWNTEAQVEKAREQGTVLISKLLTRCNSC